MKRFFIALFVHRHGDKLMDEHGELRFVSFNIPNLHYIEDNMPVCQIRKRRLIGQSRTQILRLEACVS